MEKTLALHRGAPHINSDTEALPEETRWTFCDSDLEAAQWGQDAEWTTAEIETFETILRDLCAFRPSEEVWFLYKEKHLYSVLYHLRSSHGLNVRNYFPEKISLSAALHYTRMDVYRKTMAEKGIYGLERGIH